MGGLVGDRASCAKDTGAMVFWPLMVAGGLWANAYSARDLDEISTLDKPATPLSNFWGGIFLGGILGLWAGVNFGPSLKQAWSSVEGITGLIMPGQTEPPDTAAPGSQMGYP